MAIDNTQPIKSNILNDLYKSNDLVNQPLSITSAVGGGMIVDEDFTDGAFENDSADYWEVNGLGTSFRPPNRRDFEFALSNQIASRGSSFTDNFAFSISDPNTTHPSGLQQFGINKDDEVAVVRYQTFSDVAKDSREQFHVQVALLQTDPTLDEPPDYGHDLSFETESRFVSRSASHPDRLQLTANVENQELDRNDPQKQAQKKAYFDATMTPDDLNQEYTNLVIWRNQPSKGTTNIEQWSNNRLGDYNVASEMVNRLPHNQNPDYSLFNEIRVFLQRGATNVDLIRSGVNLDDAQIGIVDLHVGVTKKTDFDLNYRTDAADFIRWNTYKNQGGVQTMQTGDADNDGDTDNEDLAQLERYLGQIHDPNFSESQSVYTYDPNQALNSSYVVPSGGAEPKFAYNAQTGELLLDTGGEALSAWIVRGQVANTVEPIAGDDWWMQAVDQTQQWVDLSLTGFSSTEWIPVASFAPGLNLSEFDGVEVGFADGGGQIVEVSAYDSDQVMGETGSFRLDHNDITIDLNGDYQNPVVFVQPPSFNGGDPGTVRLRETTNDSFSVYFQEPEYRDGWHVVESVSYMVLEAGSWLLEDGTRLEVGTVATNAIAGTGAATSNWTPVSFDQSFGNTPAVFTQVQTHRGGDFVVTRQKNSDAEGFEVAMQETEAKQTTGHVTETVGWLAIAAGTGTWSGNSYQVGITGGVTHAWHPLDLSSSFNQAPQLLAAIATFDGGDTAGLRYQNLSRGQVEVKVEEEKSLDTETQHTTEAVNFLAIEGSGLLEAVRSFASADLLSADLTSLSYSNESSLSWNSDLSHSSDLDGGDRIQLPLEDDLAWLDGTTAIDCHNGLSTLEANLMPEAIIGDANSFSCFSQSM